MNAVEKMKSGKIYFCNDPELAKKQAECLEILYDFNHTRPSEAEKRSMILKAFFAEVGENCYVEPPLHANWGCHTHFGNNVYANFNLTLVDDTHIYVGDYTMLAPNVILATAGHPLLGALRQRNYQYNMPVRIGRNCWLGAGVIVLPGVTIGDNTVVGAGSVVTKDLPANVLAVGSPARVLRPLGEHERAFYYKDRRIDPALLEGI